MKAAVLAAVCMYVYIYMYMYIHIYIYACMCTCMCMSDAEGSRLPLSLLVGNRELTPAVGPHLQR